MRELFKKEEIEKAMNEAYKEAKHNAYFSNGFKAGVKFTSERCGQIIDAWKKEVELEKAEAMAWKRYAEDYKNWILAYKDKLSSMEAGMTEPNKPNYIIANND